MSADNRRTGIIVKLIGGIYFVDASDAVYECSARGVFRNIGLSPCCGDNAEFELMADGRGVIVGIGERKNELVRPPLANLDNIVFVCSTCEPAPSLLLLDKFIAVAEYKKINPIVVFTKTDKASGAELSAIYDKCGVECCCIASDDKDGAQKLLERLNGEISAFAGNTGVGKTTLLNNMLPGISEKTGDISRKLGRGKHTTRHVSLFKLDGGGYIADTPGFSSFDTMSYDVILKDELDKCFREFSPYLGKCRYVNCSHTKERDCAVRNAVERGMVCRTRYDSYCVMYGEAKSIPEWKYRSLKNEK